ncbi:MAG: dihydroorotase family protein, partial [Nitrososphaerota archaeon]
DPGYTEKEDFESGTKAAAAGGFTLVFDMPNTDPPTISLDALDRKREIAERRAVVDFCLYAGCGLDMLDGLPSLAKAGVVAFKLWTTEVPQKGLSATDEASIRRVMAEVSKAKGLLCVHAEDQAIINRETERLMREGRRDPLAYAEARPNEAEASSVALLIRLCQEFNVHVHFVHISTREAVSILREAKARCTVTAETCPQFLLLTKDVMKGLGPYAKLSPPLRSRADNEALWSSIEEGIVETIGSDHAPHLKEEKELGWSDIWKAPSGASSIEFVVPLLLTKVNQGFIPLSRLVKCMSENVAKIYGLYPRKGVIKEGSDADLTIVDLKERFRLRTDKMYSKDRYSVLYDGWEAQGRVVATLVRGEVVMKDGEVLAKPGYGRFVQPYRYPSQL